MEQQRRERRSFSDGHKAEVVALCQTSGKSIREISRDLDLTESSVRRWVAQAEVEARRANIAFVQGMSEPHENGGVQVTPLERSSGNRGTYALNAVAFGDPLHGWAVGDHETIIATADGGAHWVRQHHKGQTRLTSVAFSDSLRGWAVGYDELDSRHSIILATTDGGATWVEQLSMRDVRLLSVAFGDAAHGWAVGGRTILATTDGGATWVKQPFSLRGRRSGIWAVACWGSLHAWVVCNSGAILATADGGAHWVRQHSGTHVTLNAVAFSDCVHGWAVGGYYTILATSDGGATWVKQRAGSRAAVAMVALTDWAKGKIMSKSRNGFRGVGCGDSLHAWAVGDYGITFVTKNSGVAWVEPRSLGLGAWPNGVAFSDATRGWAVGDWGCCAPGDDRGVILTLITDEAK